MDTAHLPEAATGTAPSVHYYQAYGLAITSELMLPELVAVAPFDAVEAGLVIRLRPVEGPMPLPGEPRIALFSDGQSYFSWWGLGRFLVRENREIDVDAEVGLEHDLLSMILLGPVMAAVLHARGHLVLHGSAVDIGENRAVLFVGDNGAGKSTLAAAFLKAGHALVNDDVIALGLDAASAPHILPGFPSMKLSRAAIASFAPLPGETLANTATNPSKLRLRLDPAPAIERRVARIYVLKRGEPIEIVALDPTAGLAALMRYSYMFKFGETALPGSAAAAHFVRCAMLAGQVIVSTLTVPDDLTALSELPAYILANINETETL